MVSGRDNISGNRKSPWRFYLCSWKKREGWSACSSGKIGAAGPEGAVLQVVADRVLTPDFVDALVAETNRQIAQDIPDTLDAQIREQQRKLDDVERSINVLLDLAEGFGSTSAGPRLVEREATKALLLAELQQLEAQRQAQKFAVSPDLVQSVLTEMRNVLTGDDTCAQRVLLSKVIAKVELGPTGGKLLYTSPCTN
jgi:hypothetical protein